jgi:hypothetical protein
MTFVLRSTQSKCDPRAPSRFMDGRRSVDGRSAAGEEDGRAGRPTSTPGRDQAGGVPPGEGNEGEGVGVYKESCTFPGRYEKYGLDLKFGRVRRKCKRVNYRFTFGLIALR